MHATPMKIFRRNKAAEPPAAPAEPIAPELPAAEAPAAETVTAKPRSGLLARLRAGLGKTRSALSEGLGTLFLGRKTLDDELLDELDEDEPKLDELEVSDEAVSVRGMT